MRPTTHPTPCPTSVVMALLLLVLAAAPMATLVQAQGLAPDHAPDLSGAAAETVSQPPRDEAPRRPAQAYYEAVVIQALAVMAPGRGCWVQAGAGADGAAGAGIGAHGQALNASPRCGDVQSPADLLHWSVVYTFHGRQYRAQLSSNPGPTLLVDRYGLPRG